ncbi:putative reverse transcriptase domain-containing protein [Tanacetum coccineum]|uniref:Reverse transcriptase domain-containing protein n=1 Tax=Tanacetum coccineum TaxID=301880 RepID=A0ABQ5HV09_9ASTR
MLIAKSPYRLAPSEMEELSSQLKELQDKGFIRQKVQFREYVINGEGIHVDPRKIEAVKNWEAPRTPSKNNPYVWGEEQEEAFQILKDKLCNAPVLALPNGPEYFVVYCDASGLGLGYVLMQRGRSYSATMTARFAIIQSSIKDRILAAQNEAYEVVDAPTEMLRGLDKQMEHRSDRAWYYLDRIWVPLTGDVRTLIMDEAHKLKYSIHPGADKMYYDLRDMYWWPTSSGHDAIWVIVDRLTKSSHFLPMLEDYKMDRLARLYLSEIIARHGVPILIISNRDSHFTSRFWQSMQEALGTRKLGHSSSVGPEIVQETTEKISQIKDMLKVARDHQKSYADKRRKPLEFSVGDHVLLKVSPWKAVVRFEKKGKLAPRLVGPFEIIERIGPKCLPDQSLHVPLEEIQVDAKLNFMEEPVEILEREFKKLKRSRIPIVRFDRIQNEGLNLLGNVRIR